MNVNKGRTESNQTERAHNDIQTYYSVSYTHLDVYKRQNFHNPLRSNLPQNDGSDVQIFCSFEGGKYRNMNYEKR